MNYFDQLLTAIDTIQDQEIHDFTLYVVLAADPRNWECATSRSHHQPDERGEMGNTLHTLRVLKMTEIILTSTDKTEYEKDISRSVSILHDCCKRGIDGSWGYTVPDHPHLVELLIKNAGIEVPDKRIIEGIRAHMGIWGKPPYIPKLTVEDIAHLSDCISAQDDVLVKI